MAPQPALPGAERHWEGEQALRRHLDGSSASSLPRLRSEGTLSSIVSRSLIVARSTRHLSKGAIAGISVGCLIFAGLLLFCLYPVVVGFINKRRRHVIPKPGVETAVPGMDSVEAEPADSGLTRRLSSTDSYIQRAESRTLERHSSKDLTLASFDGLEAMEGARDTSIPRYTSTGMISQSPVAGEVGSPAVMTDYPLTASPSATGTRPELPENPVLGHSASYYSPVYSFGIDLSPTALEAAAIQTEKRRKSSSMSSRFFRSFMDSTLRRAPRGSTSTASTPIAPTIATADVSPQQPAQTVVFAEISDSPIDVMPPPPPSMVPTSATEPVASPSPPDLSGIELPQSSPPDLPPTHPAPGTVNPREVMGAMTEFEQTWRNQNIESMPALQAAPEEPASQKFERIEFQGEGPTEIRVEEPSQPAENFSPADHTEASGIATNGPEAATMCDIEMTDIPPIHRLTPNHSHKYSNSNETYFTDPSARSTPQHHPSPSGPSIMDTPDTRITDNSPSPRSDGSSDPRQSTSPYPNLQHSPLVLRCDRCDRAFDQVHKLNHHKRYHERPHECTHPNCGKKFGTKTHLDRHINDKHNKTKKYHCTEAACSYSRHGGKSFPRKDNWRRHMTNIHGHNPHAEIEPDVVDTSMVGL